MSGLRDAALEPRWAYPSAISARKLLLTLAALTALAWSAKVTQIDRAVALTSQAVLTAMTGRGESQVAAGLQRIGSALWPLQLEERTDLTRIQGFDPLAAPPFSHLETRTGVTREFNVETLKMETSTREVLELVVPYGYVTRVLGKLFETFLIALWGTILALILSIPLGFMGARNLMGDGTVVFATRAVVSFFRAVPEIVSALFLVIAYGFGPVAGVIALGLHGAGFLGKFYADDIENADPKPQEALRALGANVLTMTRFAILPQVFPQYVAYTLYIFDRNIRMATVIGIVGAGGIGQELKGRFDMYAYGHVGTILLIIFLTVLALDQLSAKLRSRLL